MFFILIYLKIQTMFDSWSTTFNSWSTWPIITSRNNTPKYKM